MIEDQSSLDALKIYMSTDRKFGREITDNL